MSMSSKDVLRLDQLRRAAKTLKKSYDAGEAGARQAVRGLWGKEPQSHADFLHVIARQHGFISWPRLKWAAETIGLERAEAQEKLKMALYNGNQPAVQALMSATPDLAEGHFGLLCALYDLTGVEAMLAEEPGLATEAVGPRRPILHLACSHWHRMGGASDASVEVAKILAAHGADVNDAWSGQLGGPDSSERLSVLYSALGHAKNLPLARWLLEQGADPNDGESLYHATELGHADGVRMLLGSGARPEGTQALLRAIDFDDAEMVALLLAAGADPNESLTAGYNALHHAALRDAGKGVVDLLVQNGARVDDVYAGMMPHAYARLVGGTAVQTALEAMGAPEDMPDAIRPLTDPEETRPVDPAALPTELFTIMVDLIHRPNTMDQIRRMIDAGFPWDAPDSMGVTPVQAAGWIGWPDRLAYFLKLSPDLSHVNDFGGNLLGTILHGSEHAPARVGQDHLACLELAFTHGIALPRPALKGQLRPDVLEFLNTWAARYPGQVVEHGIW
ncbi:MAG: ankyrin repeat domain-containing protein [Pseudomonadota bacterium]